MADIVIAEFIDSAALQAFDGSYTVHSDEGLWSRRDDLFAHLAEAKALIIRNRAQVDCELLQHAPDLAVIGRLGVGLDNIDLKACELRHIAVCPATGANAEAIAEYVMASAFILLRWPAFSSTAHLTRAEWPREEMGRGHEIGGKTLGLIGFGSIGQVTAAKARGFGVKTIAFDRFLPADHPAWKDTERVGMDTLLERADIVSLHCPLTPETYGLLGASQLAAMKDGAILINTARGGIVDEKALASALRFGKLGGAAIDVFETEPISRETADLFTGLPNVLLTPHIAGITRQSNNRISMLTVTNVLTVLRERGL